MGAPSSSVLAVAAGAPGFHDLRGHRPDQAAAGIDRLREAASRAGRDGLAAALESPEGRVFFSFLCGNSPYLSRLLLRDLEFTQSLVRRNPGGGHPAAARRARRGYLGEGSHQADCGRRMGEGSGIQEAGGGPGLESFRRVIHMAWITTDSPGLPTRSRSSCQLPGLAPGHPAALVPL